MIPQKSRPAHAQATSFSVVWHLPGKGATEEKLTKVNAEGSQHQNRSFLVSDTSQPKKRLSTGGILVFFGNQIEIYI